MNLAPRFLLSYLAYLNQPQLVNAMLLRCYKRSADCNDAEGIALHELARLYGELGQADQAAVYYKKDLDRMDAEERQGPNYVEALFFLAKYCKSVGRYDEAEHYATRLLDSTGPV